MPDTVECAKFLEAQAVFPGELFESVDLGHRQPALGDLRIERTAQKPVQHTHGDHYLLGFPDQLRILGLDFARYIDLAPIGRTLHVVYDILLQSSPMSIG